jgi:hypothetical protein
MAGTELQNKSVKKFGFRPLTMSSWAVLKQVGIGSVWQAESSGCRKGKKFLGEVSDYQPLKDIFS